MVKKAFMQQLRFVNIFDCLFYQVQTALMQRVEILKRVWFVKYTTQNLIRANILTLFAGGVTD